MTALIQAFPASRTKMVQTIAKHLATMSGAKAEEFLIWHFNLEWDRLTRYGMSEQDVESYIGAAARAIWSLLHEIQAGAA
jgi:hypothetical protein